MRLSVVVPLFNEADNIGPLHARLTATLERIGCDYELVFVEDGSTDSSLPVLESLADGDARVKFLSLSRNFGHEVASTAGLDVADGDAVVLMDADLQDPPEVIEQMLDPWLQGFDVVYAKRLRRRGETWLKRLTSFLFYRVMRGLSSVNLPLDTGDFRLMDRRVVEAFRQFPERERFVRGLVTWLGFRQTSVEYDRPARQSGESKYDWLKLVKLAGDALLGFSVAPLRFASWLGLAALAGGVAAAAYCIIGQALGGQSMTGSTVTNLCLTLFSGTQLLALGVLGEYLGKVHREVQGRPLYLVDRQRGWDGVRPSDRVEHERRSERPFKLARLDAGSSRPPRLNGRSVSARPRSDRLSS